MGVHGLTLGSDPFVTREVRRWIERLVLESGFADSDARDLAVAFGETCANVHRHAYGGRCDGRVEIRIAIDDDKVVVTVKHDGKPFDPAAYASPDLRRLSESGYGVYLIKSLMDSVTFEGALSGGRIVLVKRKTPTAARGETVGSGGRHAEK